MPNLELLGPWVRRFLIEHLIAERSLSVHTQHGYRDTLRLLLPFVASKASMAADRLRVVDIAPELVCKFLAHLERDRRCSVATRNQRLRPSTPWHGSSENTARNTWSGARRFE